MKEDIKNLEEIINLCKEEINNNDKNITATLDLEDLKSLENLLTRYKQLEEENEQLDAIKDEAIRRYNFESIPKSKVKEKIEEYEKTYIDDPEGFRKAHFRVAILVLQELLREE